MVRGSLFVYPLITDPKFSHSEQPAICRCIKFTSCYISSKLSDEDFDYCCVFGRHAAEKIDLLAMGEREINFNIPVNVQIPSDRSLYWRWPSGLALCKSNQVLQRIMVPLSSCQP